MSKELKAQYKQFAEEFIKDFNATQAAIRTGYSVKTANRQGSRLLSNVDIQKYISELKDNATKRNDITVDRVLQELANIAFLDIGEFYSEDGTLKNIKQISETARRAIQSITTKEEQGATIENGEIKPQIFNVNNIKSADKLKALELLGRYLAMFTDKVEISVDEQVQDWLRGKIK
ncbi:terminase small subunit [Aliarcobacter butzleri]